MKEFDRIQQFIKELSDNLVGYEGAKLLTESYIRDEERVKRLDAIITVNSELLAVCEFKRKNLNNSKEQIFHLISEYRIECKYVIVSDGELSIIIDTYSDLVNEVSSVNDLLQIIFSGFSDLTINDSVRGEISAAIKKELKEFKAKLFKIQTDYNNIIPANRIDQLENAISKFEKINLHDIVYNKDGQYYYLSGDIRQLSSFENLFFNELVEIVQEGSRLFRYTSLDSAFKTIDNKMIRLGGIVGMNDISEVGYVDGYLDKKFVPMSNDVHVDAVNRKFIMCSSELEDELMQWRLYGDDCKGGCLVFNVVKNDEMPGLLLRKINYGIGIGGDNFHPELELLIAIKTGLQTILGIEFKFKTIEIWKHFFKPFEYKSEQEIRLLLIGNNEDEIKGQNFLTGFGTPLDIKWNLTASHQLLAPFIYLDISSNNLPFKFEALTLGAKCPEAVINAKQFKYLLDKRGLSNIKVQISKINNYR